MYNLLMMKIDLLWPSRQRGAIILFDSRTRHRVLKVRKGVRRSIVGWVLGPRWK